MPGKLPGIRAVQGDCEAVYTIEVLIKHVPEHSTLAHSIKGRLINPSDAESRIFQEN